MSTTFAGKLYDWLQSINAAECFDILQNADIDMELLVDLTEEDLRELGLSLGQRKRLQKGIEALRSGGQSGSGTSRAERRQLSFLFCDLIDSTVISQKMDAEDLASMQQAYHGLCSQIANRWGGRMLAQYGDGCMLVFGHPNVHENDAERAVRAGLELATAVPGAELAPGISLNCRIAIATGRVVIGDVTGGSDPNAVAGETPNLAARLQDIAKPGTVVIAESTMNLVKSAFNLDSRGAHKLKGYDQPVEAWTVTAAKDESDRVTGLGSDHHFVGRRVELELLQMQWEKALTGSMQIVTVSGEAGLGKSWLLSAFAQRVMVANEEMRRFRYFCVSFKTNSALHPFLAEIARSIGIVGSESAAQTRKRIEDWPGLKDIEISNASTLLAAQFGVQDNETPLTLNAAQQKLAMFALLNEMLKKRAAAGPVLIELEDIHWADPTTLEFLSRLVTDPPKLPVMLVTTHRPGFELNWPTLPWLTHVGLNRLSLGESIEIARLADGTHSIPEARLRDIIAKADGVPLFVEELTQTVAVLEGNNIGGAIRVPETLEASLMARLDRNAAAKSVAQIAATIGRKFRISTLAAVAKKDPDTLAQLIQQLKHDRILEPVKNDPDSYIFRHALIQDAAYGSLLRSERKKLHARIADILAEENQHEAIIEPETLARHLAGAEMHLEAVGKLIEAGQNATSRAAQIEANNHFRSALDLLKRAPVGEVTTRLEATVNALLGQSLLATVGFAAPEVGEAFDRARHLSAEIGEIPLLVSSLYGVSVVAASRGEREKTRELAEESIRLFGESDVPLFAMGSHFTNGLRHIFEGSLDEAEAALERALGYYSPELHGHSLQVYGDDLGSYALIYLLWIHALLGDFEKSLEYSQRSEELTKILGDRQVEIRTLGFAMSGFQMLGELEATEALADQVIAKAVEQCYPYWQAVGEVGKSWVLCHTGRSEEGLAKFDGALAFFDAIGQRTPMSLIRTYHAEALIASGAREQAFSMLKEAIQTCESELDTLYLPELLRLKAETLLGDDNQKAVDLLNKAHALARSKSMVFFELRSAVSLCRIEAGRPGEEAAVIRLKDARAKIRAPQPFAVLNEADEILSSYPSSA